jgi:hypothetical protein
MTHDEKLARMAAYREAHRAELRAKARAYYERTKEAHHQRRTSETARERDRRLYRERHDAMLEKSKAYREKHRAEINARAMERYYSQPLTAEQIKRKKETQSAWQKRNREYLNAYDRAYEAANRDKINAQRRALYRFDDKMKIARRRQSRKACKELRDHYVRQTLGMNDAPKELIEAKRELIKLRRIIRDHKS